MAFAGQFLAALDDTSASFVHIVTNSVAVLASDQVLSVSLWEDLPPTKSSKLFRPNMLLISALKAVLSQG